MYYVILYVVCTMYVRKKGFKFQNRWKISPFIDEHSTLLYSCSTFRLFRRLNEISSLQVLDGVLDGEVDARIAAQKFYVFQSMRLVTPKCIRCIELIHSRPWSDIEIKVPVACWQLPNGTGAGRAAAIIGAQGRDSEA
jgi:hypothetical protein